MFLFRCFRSQKARERQKEKKKNLQRNKDMVHNKYMRLVLMQQHEMHELYWLVLLELVYHEPKVVINHLGKAVVLVLQLQKQLLRKESKKK